MKNWQKYEERNTNRWLFHRDCGNSDHILEGTKKCNRLKILGENRKWLKIGQLWISSQESACAEAVNQYDNFFKNFPALQKATNLNNTSRKISLIVSVLHKKKHMRYSSTSTITAFLLLPTHTNSTSSLSAWESTKNN